MRIIKIRVRIIKRRVRIIKRRVRITVGVIRMIARRIVRGRISKGSVLHRVAERKGEFISDT